MKQWLLLQKNSFKDMNKIKAGDLQLDTSETKAYLCDEDICLTKTEYMMLKIFMENKNKELSPEEIYESVWKKDPNGDVRNIRKHVMNIRNKIKAEESDNYDIITSYGRGYTFVEY